MKRIVRSPWLWIPVAVVGVLLALQYLVPNGGYTEIETSKMVDNINSGEVKEITFVDGGDQQMRATLDRRQGGHGDLGGRSADPAGQAGAEAGRRGRDRGVQRQEPQAQPARPDPRHAASLRADRAAVPLPDEPGAGRRRQGDAVRQVQGQADHQGHAEDDVRRRRRLRGGDRGARRDQGVPAGARQVPGRRRQDPQGRAALRPARHRQDPARACGRGRGGRPVLLDLRLGLRRDVRRRRRLPGA